MIKKGISKEKESEKNKIINNIKFDSHTYAKI